MHKMVSSLKCSIKSGKDEYAVLYSVCHFIIMQAVSKTWFELALSVVQYLGEHLDYVILDRRNLNVCLSKGFLVLRRHDGVVQENLSMTQFVCVNEV